MSQGNEYYEHEPREFKHWQVQEAKAKFSAVLDAVEEEGPQVVTRRGVETAVIVPIKQWHRLTQRQQKYRSVKEWLLAPEARGDIPLPDRQAFRLRPLPDLFDD